MCSRSNWRRKLKACWDLVLLWPVLNDATIQTSPSIILTVLLPSWPASLVSSVLEQIFIFFTTKKKTQNQKETSKKPKQETPQTPQKPTTNQNKIKQTKNKTKTRNHLTWPDVISASSAYIPQAFPLLCIVYLDCILWALFSAKCCTYNGD